MKSFLLAAVAVAAISVSAGAQAATQIVDLTGVLSGKAYGFTIGAFDTSLGTLTSVDLLFTGVQTADFGVVANVGQTAGAAAMRLDSTLIANAASLGLSDQTNASNTQNVSGAGSYAVSTPTALGFNNLGPALFIGQSNAATSSFSWGRYGTEPTNGHLVYGTIASSAALRVTYNYDLPVTSPGGGPVPEPATWALMLVGFASLGSRLRRRRPSVA
ncbi:MAG: PEPxxWA-CTERM sorting domain-containing protein [Alphaproteobacteria bacterium]|nr:PEPxxWA-CTERM sorting domain-containing protein [Alphaproteobacteria bacterium]MBU1513544.1 PEPxxWA-CTERM sorting domain-containing protein [Alphaproteobacteria bacterium]MBU2094811.1 PEPxxWA-CTERM sorting domain-containing protein [Alphaproteobacteria bacterium]MBU2151068.1 PEPxxWA-CTERM sorting domain-containing protein [Alphaproteobacteria bacterium]MBU2309351.1 PEPxxWA-CTERM sorting domain-containing protein [Alphaproteobacteria bacterium]